MKKLANKLAPMLILVLLLAACGSGVPEPAQNKLKEGISALAEQDKAAFAECVVEDQREGALGVSDSYPVEMPMEPSEMTLNDWLDVQFFTDITSAELADGGGMDGETEARVLASFDYDESTFATRTFKLVKKGDAWFIDFKATLELWEELNGRDAFTAMTVE